MKVKIERRKYRRLPLVYGVEVIKPKKVKSAQTKDISIRGICLVAPTPFKENSPIEMKLKLNPNENLEISLEGKVVWKLKRADKEYHHGILITKIKEEEDEIFRKFIASKLIEFLLK